MKKIKLILSAVMLMMAVGVSAQTYTWVEQNKSFTDGTLLYTLGSYQDANNSTITLESNEVAVSLYLTNDNTGTLTDVINGTYNYYWGTYGGSPAFTNLSNTQKNNLWSLSVGSSRTYDGIKYTRLEDDRQSRHRWQREFSASKIKTSTATSVTIPSIVTFGENEYNVVAIPYAGFIFPDYYTEQYRDYCETYGTSNINSHVSTCMRGGNPYLQTVTFANNSQIRDIGAYAFAGCTQLGSIIIPRTVVSIKEAAFELCTSLTTVTFQTYTNSAASALQTIGNYVFYGDQLIQKLIFPEGLKSIGNYALIYNMSLNEIKLPNGLESVGAHFLCDAESLTTLTMPATCRFINGAFLHGCANLKTVYMLGYAEFLDYATAESDGNAFDYNHSYCKPHVNNCTFYVPENFLDDYKQHAVWRYVNDELQSGTTHHDRYKDPETGNMTNGSHPTYGNQIIAIGQTRDFEPNKWVTAIFPKGVTNYMSDANFGSKARFAEFIGIERIADEYDESVGKMVKMYNLKFKILANENGTLAPNIPAGVPGMFYTGEKGYLGYPLWNKEDETIEFTKDMDKPHTGEYRYTDPNDPLQASIFMSGYYVPYHMKDYDFYFSANKFWRVPEGTNVDIALCRCFWTIMVDGLPGGGASAKPTRFFEDETTGVKTITVALEEPTEIYDISGRKLNTSDNLKSGIYIINGKKVVVK